jgi:hypothetical protein
MRRILCLFMIFTFLLLPICYAKTVRVRGGFTKSGTYRQPYYRTSPNKTKLDNWSTKGNVNPYTGKKGTVDPYKIK